MRHYSGSLTAAVIFAIALAIIITLIGTWLAVELAFGADAAQPCLTKAQAQAKWPGQWLYWHTAQRCWDNVNTRRAISSPPMRYSVNRNPMQLGKPPIDANGSAASHSGRPLPTPPRQAIAYPALMPGGGIEDPALLDPQTMTMWPPIMDFDADPPAFIPWQKRFSFQATELSARIVATATGGEP